MLDIPQNWKALLDDETKKPYFLSLSNFVQNQYEHNIIYPEKHNLFRALELVSPKDIKVVILGQDPYFNANQANGLCFSVTNGCKIPPSLKNIFKALSYDLDTTSPKNGDLTQWATQGVLLINTILTVQNGVPKSHAKMGWEQFSDKLISIVSQLPQHIVFMLWGNCAQQKEIYINLQKNCVLKSVHPSPLSFYHGFLECKHFSMANEFLKKHGISPICWDCLS